MQVPLSWLKDYVTLPADAAVLAERLMLAGLEAGRVRVLGLPVPAGLPVKPEDATPVWDADKIVIAKVTKIEKHPDADKLKLVTMDYGASEPKTVVTGAPNIAPGQSGMKVILGLKGSKYYLADKEGKKTLATLEPKALRGIMNDAMCMSNYELGIAEDHDGIIILDESDAEPGTPAKELLGDIVIDLDVLPNMARCLGLLGVAREVAAITGAEVKTPAIDFPTGKEKAESKCTVAIENGKLSARYIAMIIGNVTVGPSPRWMRSRLQNAGMRPINNAVDITNYVMLESGQPLHAFDYDVLVKRAGGKTPAITVRSAKEGETLLTLDGVERKLSPANLVIADSAGPIALAGVMGGRDTEVTEATKTILLESAQFDFVSVRKTARQFNLFSEASTRFSRGIHPETAAFAAKRAAQLFQLHAGGEVYAGWVDCFPAPQPPAVIEFHRSEIERLLGDAMPDADVERVLKALDFKLEAKPYGWSVTPPANRLDIQCGAADLIEDLARIRGYDRLPERLLAQEMPAPIANRSLDLEETVRDRLVELGFHECINYSLTGETAEENLSSAKPVALVNAISPERSVLRRSLLAGLLENAKRHLEVSGQAMVFEIGPVFHATGAALPDEPRRLSLVMAGRVNETAWDRTAMASADFYDFKGVIESLTASLHLKNVKFALAKDVPWLHPAMAGGVEIGNGFVGNFGKLHPKLAAKFGVPDAVVGEFDLDALLNAVPAKVAYAPFSTFPPAKRDIAVVLADYIPADQVLSEVKAAGGELLTDASLFDVYTGDTIPAGTRSLAFALTFQAPDRTLSDKEIQKAHEKIEGRLRHVLKALIRGKDC